MLRAGPTSAFVALIALAPHAAEANGRFPAAYQLVQSPDDPSHVVVQVTYGLVSTRDGGATWRWTCEDAMMAGDAFDPPTQIADGGVVLAAILDGLVASTPDGCGYRFVDGGLAGRFTIDVSVSRSDPRDVLAITTDALGEGRFDSRVFRSADAGATFVDRGADLGETFVGATVDAAPSDPSRVYLTGFLAEAGLYQGVFARSEDGGASFEVLELPGTDAAAGPFLAAVDPDDPDVVFVRVSGAGGRLLRSEDGGATFEAIFTAGGALSGFALSPDGSTILVGGEADPIHRGPAEGGGFEVASELRPRCLAWFDDAVYACASEAVDDFTIGRSLDGGSTFSALYSRFCTSGPLECPPSEGGEPWCGAEWEVLRETIGADACFAGAGGSGATTTAGAGGAGASAAAEGPGGAGDGPSPPGGATAAGGCCAVAAGAKDDALAAVAVATLGLGLAAARRRPRPRRS